MIQNFLGQGAYARTHAQDLMKGPCLCVCGSHLKRASSSVSSPRLEESMRGRGVHMRWRRWWRRRRRGEDRRDKAGRSELTSTAMCLGKEVSCVRACVRTHVRVEDLADKGCASCNVQMKVVFGAPEGSYQALAEHINRDGSSRVTSAVVFVVFPSPLVHVAFRSNKIACGQTPCSH